jgi:hypothetical protein
MHNPAVLDGNKDDRRAHHDCFQRDRCVGRLLPQARQRARVPAADELVLPWLRPLRFNRFRLGVRDETPEAGPISVLYSVSLVLLLTAIGVVLFQESLNYFEVIGIMFAVVSLVLLMRFA